MAGDDNEHGANTGYEAFEQALDIAYTKRCMTVERESRR